MPLNISIDVDGTLLDESETPIPQARESLLRLKSNGHRLQLWSTGGADYAHKVAVKHKLTDVFDSYGTKPDVAIDDIPESTRSVAILKTSRTRNLVCAIKSLNIQVEACVEAALCPTPSLVNYVARIQGLTNAARQTYRAILRNGVPFHPIPFFGNLSSARAITVGLNPSSGEFESWRLWPEELDSHELALRLVGYFRHAYPLPHPWFAELQEAMSIINCPYSLSAAHVDASPWPTLSPKSLKKRRKPELLRLYNKMVEAEVERLPRLLRRCKLLKLVIIIGSEKWVRFIREAAREGFPGRIEVIEKDKLPAWAAEHQDELRGLVGMPPTVF